MSEVIISADQVGKRYILNHQAGGYRKFSDTLVHVAKAPLRWLKPGARDAAQTASKEDFWALKDVSFEIKQGEVVGIIGRNGAGKSTLLKVLSRITEPTTGRITLKGRVASLLEVGTGFHPELTGRENIFLNGAILGMRRDEIKAKFDEIVAFAEIERFLDTPVKRYSSGMYVRLAFAVAAHLEPEILIVDEVLAVGDAQFQKKCLGKMQDVAKGGGRTVLFVSHNLSSVMSLCQSGLVMERGQLVYAGKASEAIQFYNGRESHQSGFTRQPQANGNPTLVGGRWLEQDENYCVRRMELSIQASGKTETSIDLRVCDAMGNAVAFASLGTLDPREMITLEPGMNVITLELDTATWAVGSYQFSVDITLPEVQYYDRAEFCLTLEFVRPPRNGHGRAVIQSWGYGSFELPLRRL